METPEWNDPDSVLGPLIVGVATSSYALGALQAAKECLPQTGTSVKAAFKKQRSRVRKAMYLSGDNAKPYLAVVHLSEVADDAPPMVPFGHLLWSVGLYHLKDGSAAPVIGPGVTTWCLEVSLSKVAGGYLAGGLHLALLRHLWVEFMRAYDPDLIVVGGQTRFDDSWWRPLATATR
jgi:hypothetical protein